MASILKAHIFATEQEATAAIDLINEGEGIPVSADAITRTYTTVQENNGNIFIYADEVTERILGTPVDLEIISPSPF